MTHFLLIRHAHAETGMLPGILCGQCDVPLSSTGRGQVRELVARYRDERPAGGLYTSPLRRARETAAGLADAWQLPLQVEPGLQEIDCGQLDGVPIVDVERDYPDLWAHNAAQTDEAFRWPGGESYREFRMRVFAALDRISAIHPSSRVMLVTHAGVISQIIGAAHGRSAAAWEPFRPRHGTLSEVIWDGPAAISVLSFDVPVSR